MKFMSENKGSMFRRTSSRNQGATLTNTAHMSAIRGLHQLQDTHQKIKSACMPYGSRPSADRFNGSNGTAWDWLGLEMRV